MPRRDNLARYNEKRDFTKTVEPKGIAKKHTGHRYLIQKHEARRLHYDFRLELDGILKSWAVTRGPSLDPHDKRLAVEVEDHPVAYGSFEGTIPKGQYGGGTVMLWDTGTWEPIGDPHEGLEKGKLEFILHGERLKGEWTLVRMRNKGEKRNNWLLIKHADEFAREGDGGKFLEKNFTSIASRRNMQEIAANSNRVWKSNREQPKGKKMARITQKAADREVAGIAITHPDRMIYPGSAITKLQLAEYYFAIADHILPYVANRPLSMVRCPEGLGKPCFFQRHIVRGQSPHLYDTGIEVKGHNEIYMMIKDAKGLMTLVQWGVIELHPWGCRADKPQLPDRIIFDLDPDPALPFKYVIEGAKDIRARMKEFDLQSFVKTTGGKGLHVVIPIERNYRWPAIKAFAKAIALSMEHDTPRRYIAKASKSGRKGKIFVDYLRNELTATAIAPFSARAREGAPVAVPLAWEELTPSLKPSRFTIETLPQRLAKLKKDPWKDFLILKQKLSADYLRALAIKAK